MDENIDKFLQRTSAVNRDIAEYYLVVADNQLDAAVQYYNEDTRFASIVAQDDAKDSVEAPERLKLLEWNVQGLLGDKLMERMAFIAELINRNEYEAVFMQEMVPDAVEVFKQICENYELHLPKNVTMRQYFAAMLTLKSSIQVDKKTTVDFQTSTQGRHAVVLKCRKKSQKLTFVTSHLESCKPMEAERISQLGRVVELMRKEDEGDNLVVFAADTNLRDYEYEKFKKSPEFDSDVRDAWEELGGPQESRYSWDLTRNDNQVKGGKGRLRFERVYFRGRDHGVSGMKFVGTERLECGLFPSDHWGVEVTFSGKR